MCENNTIKIGFWNIMKNELSIYVNNLINEEKIDILVLAEYENLNINNVKENNKNYMYISGYNKNKYVCFFIRKEIIVQDFQDLYRYSIIRCKKKKFSINLVGLHLQSNLQDQKNNRNETIRKINNTLSSYETTEEKSLIIGDFNIPPYDESMISFSLFNSILFKDLMIDDYIVFDEMKYYRFYNPVYCVVSEKDKNYGSYYSDNRNTTRWIFYDQCLIRKSLMNNFVKVLYKKEINQSSLLINNKPNKEISDHLPLVIELCEENKYER